MRLAFWFLVLSYAIGSPLFAVAEAWTGVLSERFSYPSGFLYLVSGLQLLCALALFRRSLVPWSIAVLTVIAIGAVYSHFRIESPITALPALFYVAVQVWYGVRTINSE